MDNWRLREETLKRLAAVENPSEALLGRVLDIIADDNLYYEVRILACEALAKRLGGVVKFLDIRNNACIEAESLGGKAIAFDIPQELAAGSGGYARSLSPEWLEMEEANPLFAATDVAMVVGACDVVNPAAITATGTPISGMPILLARDARRIIVCNYDGNPGYSGVTNPLYENAKTIKLFGDAGKTVASLIDSLAIR